ncbi:MAG: type II secretion system protein GspN [Thermodesulfovibrionales bacterium]
MKYLLAVVLLCICLVPGIWLIAIPEETLLGLAERSFDNSSVRIEFSEFRKGFFYNFTAGSIVLKKNDTDLVRIENVSGRIALASLLSLKLPLLFSGDLAGGSIQGELQLLKRDRAVLVRLDNARTEQVPFFELLGLKGNGLLSGNLVLHARAGEVTFELREAKFSQGTFGSLTVPLEMFTSAKGAISINGRTLKVVSFALDGSGIYARVKGDITDGRLNLMLELMPDREFTDKSPIFAMLDKYKVSPGYYAVPLKNQLSL